MKELLKIVGTVKPYWKQIVLALLLLSGGS